MRSTFRAIWLCVSVMGLVPRILMARVPLAKTGDPNVAVKGGVRLRIGAAPFDDPTHSAATATEDSLKTYFKAVGDFSEEHSAFRVEVALQHGNYYQIVQWMRDGRLDGAVVSPFSAFLLMRDRNLAMFPAVELVRHSVLKPLGATPPVIIRATLGSIPLAKPKDVLGQCLEDVLASLNDVSPVQRCELRLINHLSTTGFILPLLYIDDHFVTRPRWHLTPEQETKFWNRLLEWSRFEMWHDAEIPPRPGMKTLHFSDDAPGRLGESLPPVNGLPSLNDVLLLGRRRSVPADPAVGDRARRDAIVAGKNSLDSPIVQEMLLPDMADGTPDKLNMWVGAGAALSRWASEQSKSQKESLWNGYSSTAPWSEGCRVEFADRVRDLFDRFDPHTPLGALFKSWYQEQQYAFTVDELIDLLRHGSSDPGAHEW